MTAVITAFAAMAALAIAAASAAASAPLLVSVAFIAAVPGIIAGIPSLVSLRRHSRDHGGVQERLGALETTMDRRLDGVETSVSALSGAVQAIHIRQELHEANVPARRAGD